MHSGIVAPVKQCAFSRAPSPEDADQIVIQEDADRSGDKITVTFKVGGDHIRLQAAISKLATSRRTAQVNAERCRLPAAMNVAEVPVVQAGCDLATGDELVMRANTGPDR